MKHLFSLLPASISVLLFTGCISQRSYDECQESLAYYKTEALQIDSLNNVYRQLETDKRVSDIYYQQAINELELVTATNIGLHKSYLQMLARYNAFIEEHRDIFTTTSYESFSLQEQLSAQQTELERTRGMVNQMEKNLYHQESQLAAVTYTAKGVSNEKSPKMKELEYALQQAKQRLDQLKLRMDDLKRGFSDQDLVSTRKHGRLYLSLSQNLLFRSGATQIDSRGRDALRQIAVALNEHPDLNVTVEGHTDTDGSADQNWDLSVNRASAVVKILIAYGVDPTRLTAAGKAFYSPVASNTEARGKTLNCRTDIILSPKLDDIYRILGED